VNKQIIMTNGFPVKVYTNAAGTQAVLFFLFGRYASLSADSNVLDFATDFLLGNHNVTLTHSNYLNSLEDTVFTNIDKIAG